MPSVLLKMDRVPFQQSSLLLLFAQGFGPVAHPCLSSAPSLARPALHLESVDNAHRPEHTFQMEGPSESPKHVFRLYECPLMLWWPWTQGPTESVCLGVHACCSPGLQRHEEDPPGKGVWSLRQDQMAGLTHLDLRSCSPSLRPG